MRKHQITVTKFIAALLSYYAKQLKSSACQKLKKLRFVFSFLGLKIIEFTAQKFNFSLKKLFDLLKINAAFVPVPACTLTPPKTRFFSLFAAICIAFPAIFILIGHFTVYELFFCGKQIGIVKNTDNFWQMMDRVDRELDKTYQADIYIDKTDLSFKKSLSLKFNPLTEKEFLNYLKQNGNLMVHAYAININGINKVFLADENEAEKFLNKIKALYASDKNVIYQNISFIEKIKIIPQDILLSELNQYEQALCNIVSKESLTVSTIEKKICRRSVPYKIKYENTKILYKGDRKIKQAGKEGISEISILIEKHNGIKMSEKIIDIKTLKEPVDQVILIGTKDPPASDEIKALKKPARGILTSRFGWRNGNFHKGIDIAAKTGTPVTAAEKGIVIYAGWYGGYGLTVIIDHGNGKTTLYGHCSEIFVNKGDCAGQGQLIGTVGSTGRSTGPHLHFEVRINEIPKNPLLYVNY